MFTACASQQERMAISALYSSLIRFFHSPHTLSTLKITRPSGGRRSLADPRLRALTLTYSVNPLHLRVGAPHEDSELINILNIDQIARQVEDPGLKHSSQTHVGLELSIRHAAEFFAFYICRFILADVGLLMDKFVKKGTEWAVA